MSKISETKALEAYPNALIGNLDNLKKDGFIKGYDQALQDFIERLKDCSTFTYSNGYKCIDDDLYNKLVEDFKNYMEKDI